MTPLIESYRRILMTIRHEHCVWIEGRNGWYHTYDRAEVTNRIAEIEMTIQRLEVKHFESR